MPVRLPKTPGRRRARGLSSVVSKGSIPTAGIVNTARCAPGVRGLSGRRNLRGLPIATAELQMPHRHHRNANAAPSSEPRRARLRPSRQDWIAGTLVELDADGATITVRVDSGGRPHPARGAEVTLDVASARVRATDGDGRPSLTDLFPGDRVHVTLRGAAVASRVEQRSPGAPRGGLRRLWQS